MRLVIAVSGTPGTGKSVFARALAKEFDAKLVDLNALIRRKGLYRLDADGTRVARMPEVRKELARILGSSKGPIVVEGLLAHLLQTRYLSHVVVLRTRPRVLERRLLKRKYSKTKIRDNVEAEALSIILWEAVQAHGAEKVYEIDTTRLEGAPKLFLDALAGRVSLRPGKVDWLEEYYGKRS